jgi:ribosome maturation factor RimP
MILGFSDRVEHVIGPVIDREGFCIVRIKSINTGFSKNLQIMIENKDGRCANIGDCEKISRIISPLLDVELNIADAYRLEVSSCGLYRPLIKNSDFKRFLQERATIKTIVPIDEQKRFSGIISDATEDHFVVTSDDRKKVTVIDYTNLSSAHLDPILDYSSKK